MGRMIPVADDSVINPALPISLMVAGMAATMAIITGLCGFLKKQSPPPLEDNPDLDKETSAAAAETKLAPLDTEEVMKELPPPPCMRSLSYNNLKNLPESATTRKLNFTFSMNNVNSKHSRSISVNKFREKVIKPKPADQDSLWKKTIILGGKCKLSDGEDHQQDGEIAIPNAINYRVASYHPRTASLSRTSSFQEQDITTPNQQEEEGITRKDQERSDSKE